MAAMSAGSQVRPTDVATATRRHDGRSLSRLLPPSLRPQTETEVKATDQAPAECTPPVVPAPVVEAPVDTSPNAHGKAVSAVAQSDAVGGKNCNHGGAVSAAAKKDHSGPHGNAAKGSHGKGKGKGHGKP